MRPRIEMTKIRVARCPSSVRLTRVTLLAGIWAAAAVQGCGPSEVGSVNLPEGLRRGAKSGTAPSVSNAILQTSGPDQFPAAPRPSRYVAAEDRSFFMSSSQAQPPGLD